MNDPPPLPLDTVLALQRTVGNRAIARRLARRAAPPRNTEIPERSADPDPTLAAIRLASLTRRAPRAPLR